MYLNADEEESYTIAQANSPINQNGKFTEEQVSCRRRGDFIFCGPSEIDFMDVNPQQLVSVAASLIPFLENDDANRALMGSNMMRQAVPLVKSEAPLVGTGFQDLYLLFFWVLSEEKQLINRRVTSRVGSPQSSSDACWCS